MNSNASVKVAIVTGAGTGIGAAIANTLANMGWHVFLAGRTIQTLRDTADKIVAAGGVATCVVTDVTSSSDVQDLMKAVGPRLDAVIHSAGIGHCLTIDELDEAEWKNTLDVAVTGAFLTTKYALPLLRKTLGSAGNIIQICSLASGGTWELEVGYGTAKAAQLKFTLHLHSQLNKEAEEGGRKIYAHVVCPGTVDTPFWNRIPQRQADPELTLSAQEVAWVVQEIIASPTITVEQLDPIKPRKAIVIERHKPFEAWDNVIALKHESHP